MFLGVTMKILVTGGCGYIGSHVVNKLLNHDHRVSIYDNLSTGRYSDILHGAKLFFGDVETIDQMDLTGYDAVMHFAGSISVYESTHNPVAYYLNNTANTMKVLKACDKYGINKLIFSSTAAVYGDVYSAEPVHELSLVGPLSPYATSKLMCERIISDHAAARVKSGFKYVILRYFNVAGIGGGNGPQKSSEHLIKMACEAALGKRPYLRLYGTNYSTPDGTCIRDYIHVEDVASAHVDALNYLKSGGTSDLFNVGYGKGHSVREVIASVKRVSGESFDVQLDLPRAGDAAKVVADSSKIKKILGWSPMYDNIDDIVASSLDWERNHG
jgi:UDP-glucose 4-epimerase